MHGQIIFHSIKELSDFLKEFHGSTAVFSVKPDGTDWVLTFTGHY